MTQIGETQMAGQQGAPGGPGAVDPYEAAMHTAYTPPPALYYGSLGVQLRPVILERGVGRVAFDPARHEEGQQRLEISLTLTPVDAARGLVSRELLATDRVWVELVRPSLVAAGTDLRRVNGQWVEMTLVPDGRKYTDRTGQERQSTTLKLLRVFPDEAACLEAYRQQQAGQGPAPAGPGAQPPAAAPAAPAGTSRETAARFLKGVWESAGHDVARMEEKLRAMPVLAAHFTIDSPEVLAVIAEQAAAPPAPPAIRPPGERA